MVEGTVVLRSGDTEVHVPIAAEDLRELHDVADRMQADWRHDDEPQSAQLISGD